MLSVTIRPKEKLLKRIENLKKLLKIDIKRLKIEKIRKK